MLSPRPGDRDGAQPGAPSRHRARARAGALVFALLLAAATVSAQTISGTVFEDVNYGGGAGRDRASAGGPGRPAARVELYDDAGGFLSFTATDAAGAYAFAALTPGSYSVRVVNASVTSSRAGYVAGLLPVQTFRTDAASGVALPVTNRVGGEIPALADAGNGATTLAALTTATTTAQSVTPVTLGAVDVTGVDFGYSFDVVVNVNDAGQGSLRQFLTNANALANPGLAQVGRTAGIDNAVFEIPGPGPHTIRPLTWLPSITNPVVLDGTTQPGFSGTPIIELDGSATTYGTGLDAGLKILAGSSTVRGLVINRFAVDGIRLETGSNNVIQGNYLGTDVSGLLDRGNAFDGVFIVGGSGGNHVGGLLAGQGNVISGNDDEGLDLRSGSGNRIQGNLIGIGADGTTLLGNVSDGVQVTGGTGNAVTANRIAANGGLGIDLRDDGVTLNDPLDVDTGPNDVLNFPAITSVSPSGGTLTVSFQLDVPAGSYRIEFFRNPSGVDASGYGEGEVFTGTRNLTHPGGGALSFNHTFAGNAGNVITATATACTDGAVCSTFGSTSEFSNAVTAATTAVRLMSFTAVPRDRAVDLAWQTGSELDNIGFHVYRGPSATGPWTRLDASIIPGLGSSPLGQSYSWRDGGLANGVRYYYRLEDVDTHSVSTSHGPVSAVPGSVSAEQPAEAPAGAPQSSSTDTRTTCPAWVWAAYAGLAFPGEPSGTRCTRHGDPEAVSIGVTRTASDATVELRTDGFYAVRDASGGVRVFVPGFDYASEATAAALPLKRVMVDAVVGRGARLASVEALDWSRYPGLVPAALGRPEMVVARDGTVHATHRALARAALQGGLRFAPEARLAGVSFLGESKTVTVELSPLRYDSAQPAIQLARRLRVRIAFTGVEPGERGHGFRGRHPRHGRGAGGGGTNGGGSTPSAETLARLFTTARGLHAVAFETVFPAGHRPIAVSSLRLQRAGEALALHVEPGRPSFGPGGVLYFFAPETAASADYTGEMAYELVVTAGGASMPSRAAAPNGPAASAPPAGFASFETNRFYQPGLLEAPDLWLWDAMGAGAARTKPFTLSGVDPSAAGALVVFLQGGSESGNGADHHLRAAVNGVDVGETTFAGKKPSRLTAPVPAGLLREGANELTLTNVGDTGVASLVFLDRFEVEYPRTPTATAGLFEGRWSGAGATAVAVSGTPAVLDVTAAPQWLTGFTATGSSVRFQAEAGHRYVVAAREGLLAPRVAKPEPTTLRDTASQADYVLIAPQAFLPAAQPLVERRQSQGLAVKAVSLEEIASTFGGGPPSAEAIRDFLAYAYQSWRQPSPRYVLLLGGASYDPRNFTGTSRLSPLPYALQRTSFLWTASDPALAAVNGEDEVPDLALGRLPAHTVAQAEALVAKVLDWEDSGQSLEGHAVLVADNPDPGGDFDADVDDIARSFLAGRETQVLKLSQLGAATRPAVFDAWNAGASLVSYVGHGAAAVWASENLLSSFDVPSLLAQPRQPLLLTLNCLNGYFIASNFDSLAEALVKADGHGAIAAVSPSGLSMDGPAHVFHRALMAEVTSGQHHRLGDAFLAAQQAYARSGEMPELLSVYHLFADPAMRIR